MRYIISSSLASASILTASLAMAQVPHVVTDIPPVQSLVAAVMGALGQPDLLLTPGASEHSFQLRPSQAQAVAGADLVVMIGPELTPWLDAALALRPADAPLLPLLASEGTWLQAYAETGVAELAEDHDHAAQDHDAQDHGGATEDHDHDHATDADATGHHHAIGEAHHHAGTDPHAWLDPANATLWLGKISEALAALDPENAKTYASNAVNAAEAIAFADHAAQALLDPVKAKPFATAHAAFGYYVHYYGLSLAGAVAAGDAASPGAGHVTDLRGLAKAGQITCLFPEMGHDPALLERITEGTASKIGGILDPLGANLPSGAALYPALILSTAETLAACLGG